MRGGCLIAVLLYTAQSALFFSQVHAEEPSATTPSLISSSPASPAIAPAPASQPQSDPTSPASPAITPAPVSQPQSTAETPPPPSQPESVVQIIRAQLAEPSLSKGVNGSDLAALQAFYEARTGGPLWTTEMGLSARAQAALFEISKADDWGLDTKAFELPPVAALPKTVEEQAAAEIKLDLAILKYARFARGGRLNPPAVSDLFDQAPPVRDPKSVLTEIAAADAPDQYLQSLHPKHDQFVRLRQALLKARGEDEKPQAAANERDIRRLVINMERWRWMPEDLGGVYVWNNAPEFMLYVVKNGKTIYADKTLVGTIGYATPVFTADMKTIVFNPDWVAPTTVVTENLLPPLREGNYSILSAHELLVSYQGKPVDPARVDWGRVNILNYTFTQKTGPNNVLGKVKFLFPNKHTVYMHDTVPFRKKLFKDPVRLVGHECVRMQNPLQFAEVLLAEDKKWEPRQVEELWNKGTNSSIAIDRKIPVHMTYFTTVVNDTGKVSTFADAYGLDRKMAIALFGEATGFPQPPPEAKQPQEGAATTRPTSSGGGIASSLGSFLRD
jgi:L,D-transpeptidase YcbB